MGNSDSKEEIIVKCTLEEMVRHFFKDYVVVWHDPNVNSHENQQHITQLKQFCDVLAFTEWEKALMTIRESKAACHVITSGMNGEVFVETIYESSNVAKIYVFCMNREYHSTWAKKYHKISCVETNIQNLINQINQNLLEWYREISSLKVNLPAFAPIFNDGDKSQMNHLHRYLKVISTFKNRIQAKKDFLNLSRLIYTDLNNTKNIADFEKYYNEYNKAQILRWYTRESFLYKVTNNCLRIATSDSIQYCRFLLKDLEQAIKDQYQVKSKYFNGLLYRGAYLSSEEWSNLKENRDKEIEMHGFLSVSKEKNVALNFMQTSPHLKVLITIVVPKGPNEEDQGFAEIEEYSFFPQEREILFNVRSRFTVIETEDEYSPELPYRHLVLLYGAQGFRKFTSQQNSIFKFPTPNVQNIPCCHCTHGAPENFLLRPLDKQIYYCKNCIDKSDAAVLLCVPLKIPSTATEINVKGCLLMSNSSQTPLPFYGYKCSQCQANKQKFYFVCTDCSSEKKLLWCENCFAETVPCIQAQHTILIETHPFSFWCEKMSESELSHFEFHNSLTSDGDPIFRQAEMYYNSHNYDKAIEYCSLYIQQSQTKIIDPKRGTAFCMLGYVYSEKKEYQKALEYHLKALEFHKSIFLGLNHPSLAAEYGNVGLLYMHLKEYAKALECHDKALNISKSLRLEKDVATAYFNIGLVYRIQGEYHQALEYLFKAVAIQKSLHGENHTSVAESYNCIGLVYDSQKEYPKALEYHLKSLDIRKSLYGENHPNVATSYNNMASVFSKQGEYNKALEYHSKSLNVKKALYGENHPEVTNSFYNIASVFSRQKEYNKALEYHLKALEIRKSLYGEKHPDTAISYNSIAIIFSKQKEYNKAIEYHLKYLEIKKLQYGENHPEVATSYLNLASVFSNQEEHIKALECNLKALEVKTSLYGEIHPEVATSYSNLASDFSDQGEYNTALEYYLKCLNIEKSLYGENHSDVAISYSNLASVSSKQEDYSNALEYNLKCLNIEKSLYGENHPEVATSYCNIASDFCDQGEYNKALEYRFKALEIKKALYGEDSSEVATSYNNIASVFSKQGEDSKALEYRFKALDVQKAVYGESSSHVANSYRKIGSFYQDRKEYTKALEYHLKSLDITKSLDGENHPDIARSYDSIGYVYLELKEDTKAFEYFLKSLEIKKLLYEENSENIAASYYHIGKALNGQGEYNKALEYHFKALNIKKEVFGENKHQVANSYYNIAGVYINQKEHAKALEYCLKALEIRKSVSGDDHSETLKIQNRILEIKSFPS